MIDLIEKLQGMKEGDFNLNCNYFDKHYTIQLNNNGGVEVGFYIKEGYDLQWYLSISIDGETITVNALYEKIYRSLLKAKTKLQTL